MKAYLSSTLDDLQPDREAVTRALEGSWIVKQSYVSNEGELVESCLDDVVRCDVCIVILGMRYGFIPPGFDKSITELEYDCATSAGIPRFVFLKSPDEIRYTQGDRDATRIEAFRQRVSAALPEGTRPAQFTSAEDLQVKLLQAIDDWKERRTQPLADSDAWEVAARPVPPRPYCVGRDALLASLVLRLVAEAMPSALLLGRPGVGKTTLALAALHDPAVEARFGNRRYFTRCDGFKSRAGLARAIAASIGLQVGTPGERAVVRELGERPALIILDGVDSAWHTETGGTEEFLAGLATTPGLAIVATRNGAESMGPVVRWGQVEHVQELDPASAKAMFLELAGGILPTDRRLGPLVQVLGGVPLAIVLMAHQAQGESDLRQLSRRWRTEKVAMLERAGGREVLTSLELSYELALRDLHQSVAIRLLARAALLARGIANEDVDAVVPVGAGGALAALRAAALVAIDPSRIRVPSPLREYVKRTAADASDRNALVRHYLALARLLEGRLANGDAEAVGARLAADAGNIEWAIGRGLKDLDRSIAIDAAIAWCRVARYFEGASWGFAERAAAMAAAGGDTRRQGKCLLALGDTLLARATPERAYDCFQRAQVIFRTLNDDSGEAKCLHGIGKAALSRSDLSEAREIFDAARQMFERLGDQGGHADCLMGLASVAWVTQPRAETRARFVAALDLYRRCGDTLGQANALRNVADLDVERSAFDAAEQGFRAAAALYVTVGDLLQRAHCAFGMAEISRARCPDLEAQRQFERVRQLYRRMGHIRGEADCLYRQGDIARARGDKAAAELAYSGSGRLYDQWPWTLGRANVILALSNLALGRGDDETADAGFTKALTLYDTLSERAGQGSCRLGFAQLASKRADRAAAQGHYAAALAHFEAVEDPYDVGLVHLLWAEDSADIDRTPHLNEARRAWGPIPRPYLLSMCATDGVLRDRIEALFAEGSAT